MHRIFFIASFCEFLREHRCYHQSIQCRDGIFINFASKLGTTALHVSVPFFMEAPGAAVETSALDERPCGGVFRNVPVLIWDLDNPLLFRIEVPELSSLWLCLHRHLCLQSEELAFPSGVLFECLVDMVLRENFDHIKRGTCANHVQCEATTSLLRDRTFHLQQSPTIILYGS